MGIRRFFSDFLVLWRASGHAADQCLGTVRATPRRTADRGDGAAYPEGVTRSALWAGDSFTASTRARAVRSHTPRSWPRSCGRRSP
jgi:hypothetical protein